MTNVAQKLEEAAEEPDYDTSLFFIGTSEEVESPTIEGPTIETQINYCKECGSSDHLRSNCPAEWHHEVAYWECRRCLRQYETCARCACTSDYFTRKEEWFEGPSSSADSESEYDGNDSSDEPDDSAYASEDEDESGGE